MTAGDNITIDEINVISSTGGGGGGLNAVFNYKNDVAVTINNQYVIYSVKETDTYDAMNTTSGEYTIPVDGIYYFTFTIIIPVNSNTFGKIYKNGTAPTDQINGKGEYAYYSSNIQWTEHSFFGVSQCVQGDIIRVYAKTGRLEADSATRKQTNLFIGFKIQ